jgi:FkbM family methyltransferase
VIKSYVRLGQASLDAKKKACPGMTSTPRHTMIIRSIFGELECYKNDHITKHIESFGAHARPNVAMLRTMLREGDAIVDAGAHVGSFTIPLAKAVGPGGAVFAIEANPETYAILCRNLERHGIKGKVYCGGVSDESGAKLYMRFDAGSNSGADSLSASGWGPAVGTVRIDDLTDQPISLIKIDVEGMEMKALKSAKQTIDRDRPVIFMEYAPHRQAAQGHTAQDFQAFFEIRKYRILVNIGPGQGDAETFQIGEIDDLRKLSLMTDLLLMPAESDRMPSDIACTTSPEMKRYLLRQKLRHWSGIPKRLLRRLRQI